MAKITSINIKNYKGVDNVRIDVEGGKSPGRFITMVGLNESGKTSILEAISLSILEDPDTADLLEATEAKIDLSSIVPKHASAGFNGEFQIAVSLDLSEHNDLRLKLQQISKDDGYRISENFSLIFTVTKNYVFDESNYKTNNTTWSFVPTAKRIGGSKNLSMHLNAKPTWFKCISAIKEYFPQVIYFPTFIVEFPRRVYLEGKYGKLDSFYRQIMSDALNGLEQPLQISKHILDRVNVHRKARETFSSALRSSKEGRQIDATVQALAAELNRVIFGAWGEVFDKPVNNRNIVIEWHIDEKLDNHIYLEFYIIAGEHRFYIAERSLGFRWFFSFLLFTQFQSYRTKGRKLIFLFDEPASHLHPKAQERLLKSFEKIADPRHIIIYTTHSHYLVNPTWLEQAYIISNRAIEDMPDATGIDNLEARVKITAEKYKTFISKNPSKTTYYQPVLDVLDYSPGGLSIVDPVIILE